MPPDPVPLWQQLNEDSPEAWQQLLAELLPAAMRQIREGFELPADEDQSNPAAAFMSAWPSFRRHFLTEKELQDAQDFGTLATHFVRIAYNRSQRKKRQAQKMQRAVDHGSRRAPDGKDRPFEAVDPSQGPGEEACRKDFFAYFRQLVDEQVGTLKEHPRKFQIVRMWLDEDLQITQARLAERHGVHQSTVARILDEFKEGIRQRLREADVPETELLP